jgi:hypothetical protein
MTGTSTHESSCTRLSLASNRPVSQAVGNEQLDCGLFKEINEVFSALSQEGAWGVDL